MSADSVRVVLVDDHVLVRSGLRVLLNQMAGIAVVGEASDGREAVERVQELKPDLVILDIQMPELNGLDALEQLRRAHPDVRLVVLSMYSNPETVQAALSRGADGYVVKAAAQEELEFAVRAALRGDIYLSPAVTRSALETERTSVGGTEQLTMRQREILQLVVEGNSTKGIARKLGLSIKTVEAHRSQLMSRLGIKNVPGLVRYAMRAGIIPGEE